MNADLIVMATHGRRGLEKFRFGSVAEGLVSKGIAPILLVHPGPDGTPVLPEAIERVVVPLDRSGFAEGVLDPLEIFGKAVGVSSYTLLHVADGKGPARAVGPRFRPCSFEPKSSSSRCGRGSEARRWTCRSCRLPRRAMEFSESPRRPVPTSSR